MRFYVSSLWVISMLDCVHVLFVHSVLLVIFGVRLYALTPLRIVSLFKNVLTMPISFCIMRLSNMNWQRDSGRRWEHKTSVGGRDIPRRMERNIDCARLGVMVNTEVQLC